MERKRNNKTEVSRTTIGLKRTTKNRLDRGKSPGQSYDGFVRQLLALWERVEKEKLAKG